VEVDVSQHYVPPDQVVIPFDKVWPTKFLKAIIERDGLIVPILVRVEVRANRKLFVAADRWQAQRVIACSELSFETILIEDEWEEEDL
jgi:CRISPR/Cas system CSM-associated protein Csm3 (group 7 of RAMP superfamily)